MIRISHIAAPGVLGLGLALGLVSCAERSHDIPEDAVILREGKHSLSATAIRAGTVYVYDDSAHKLLYSGSVARDDNVMIDPTADRITINGKTVAQSEIDNDHKFKIFLDENTVSGRTMSETTVTTGTDKTVIRKEGDSTVITKPDSNTTVITKPNEDTTIIQKGN